MARISKYRSDAGAQLGRVQYPIGTKGVPTERAPLWNESTNVKHREPLFGQRKDGAKLSADKVYPKRVDPYANPYKDGCASRLGGVALPDKRWAKSK